MKWHMNQGSSVCTRETLREVWSLSTASDGKLHPLLHRRRRSTLAPSNGGYGIHVIQDTRYAIKI
jgi:hypothetical protein